MADKKLSELTEAASIADTDLMYVSSGGVSKKVVGGKFNSVKLANSGFNTTLQSGTLSGDVVHTLPNSNGNLLSDGKPCISAYLNGNQSITSGVNTKIGFNTKNFDTTTSFNTTSSRFMPLTGGYYSINVSAKVLVAATAVALHIYKNGTLSRYTVNQSSSAIGSLVQVSTIELLDGIDDYIEAYIYIIGTSPSISGISMDTKIQASYISGV